MQVVDLPEPSREGVVSVEESIQKRRSVRSFMPDALDKEKISRLLWSARGVTETGMGLRAAPSAAAMGLGSLPVGAFDDQEVADVLSLPQNQAPVYIIPVGYPG